MAKTRIQSDLTKPSINQAWQGRTRPNHDGCPASYQEKIGNRGQMTKLLQKGDRILKKGEPQQSDLDLLTATISNIENRTKTIEDLDEIILQATEDGETYEHLFEEAEYYNIHADCLKWTTFIDTFKAAVDDDPTLEDIQKFQYLSAQLVGEAARTIEGLQLTNANYTEAMQLLKTAKQHEKSHNRNGEKNVTHVKLTPTQGPVLLKTTRGTVSSEIRSISVNVLLDEGAQRTFITEETARSLSIRDEDCQTEHLNLGSFGNEDTGIRAIKAADIKLKTKSGDITMRTLIVPKISSPVRNHVDAAVNKHLYLQQLPLAPQVKSGTFEIDMLIGADYYWSIVEDRIVRGDGPTAVASKLGYLLSGPTKLNNVSVMNTTIMRVLADTEHEQDLTSKYWELETIGISIPEEKDGKKVFFEEYRDNKIKRDGNKYVASLPWKESHPTLPTNYALAKTRTRSMVRRLTTELRHVYDSIIKEQLNRNFIEKVENDDQSRGHYIPHHPVEKTSSTTPVRIVYNCSAKYRDQPSLNDCLEPGPPITNDMVEILLRFRVNQIAISSDIEKAFLNVSLADEDREYTKFFWLEDPDDPESNFVVHRFKVVLFGSTSSPFMLNAVIKTHLENQTCEIADDLKRNIYVDNLLSGSNTTTEAEDYYRKSSDVMSDAGFNLRSWATNDSTLHRTFKSNNGADCAKQVNVLGLRWDTQQDTLHYPHNEENNPNDGNGLTTKREIVRYTSRLYDPLGYLSPVHVQAKSFIQQLWKSKLSWDEPLPDHLETKWQKIQQEFEAIKKTVVNRRYFAESGKETDTYELHAFADASKITAYGAAIYLRKGDQTALVMAKTRVNPTQEITLPRLELMAAVIATRLSKLVERALTNVTISRSILWSDSQIAIHWLRSGKKLPVFVENRVREILDGKFNEIKYCPTAENPADLLTRGISADDLKQSELWWKGPQWLSTGKWPKCELFDSTSTLLETTESETEPEKPNRTSSEETFIDVGHIVDIERFHSLPKLLRVTAYVNRFVSNLKSNRETRNTGPITAEELSTAEIMWIHQLKNYRHRL
ncbi:uncharacterized protein [Ptychodera flava]|uniref:uncharacterized protein n=1 Tax=Ptychodera flava TaxID=63121 RepID=UPI00396A7D01